MAKNERGFLLTDDGLVQFHNFIQAAVLPVPHHCVVAIQYVDSQELLDGVLARKAHPHQLQVGLNSQQCRHVAEQLLRAATILENDAPPPKARN